MLVPAVLQHSAEPGDLTLVLSTGLVTADTSVTEFSVPGHRMHLPTVASTPNYGSIPQGSESVETIALELFVDVYKIIINIIVI